MSSNFATVIERFLITSTNTVLRAELPIVLTAGADALTQTPESVERNHIQYILDVTALHFCSECGAAQIQGLKPPTLESRVQKLRIVRHE
jgi:transcriptional regulator with GAF, ATPase, and Fis domain